MPVSATASELLKAPTLRCDDLADLVGGTPLIQLRRSGEGLVWVKHEGLQPGGSYFDRVALAQINELGADTPGIVVEGTTSFTVSALTLANARELRAVVIVGPEAPPRLLGLIRKLSHDVRTYKNAEERSALLGALEADGLVFLDRHDAASHLSALTDIAMECQEACERPLSNWVVIDYGVPAGDVERALRRVLGHAIQLVMIEDDRELERTLDGSASSRRAQIGHREGLLIGPIAAEVIDRAVDVAVSSGERVCALIPDGGQRYLGWW